MFLLSHLLLSARPMCLSAPAVVAATPLRCAPLFPRTLAAATLRAQQCASGEPQPGSGSQHSGGAMTPLTTLRIDRMGSLRDSLGAPTRTAPHPLCAGPRSPLTALRYAV